MLKSYNTALCFHGRPSQGRTGEGFFAAVPTQHLQYLPFGENFIEQRTTTDYYSPYTFSAKERDTESGYSYFGARYYDADISVWLSVDPMADKYPSMSAYMYCAGNPVKLIDPDGRDIVPTVEFMKSPYVNILLELTKNNSIYQKYGFRLSCSNNTYNWILGYDNVRNYTTDADDYYYSAYSMRQVSIVEEKILWNRTITIFNAEPKYRFRKGNEAIKCPPLLGQLFSFVNIISFQLRDRNSASRG